MTEMTSEQVATARAEIVTWYTAWQDGDWTGDETPHDMLAEWRNARHAEVHPDGDLYIEGPCRGHYLPDDAAVEFVAWLRARKAIAG